MRGSASAQPKKVGEDSVFMGFVVCHHEVTEFVVRILVKYMILMIFMNILVSNMILLYTVLYDIHLIEYVLCLTYW